MVDLHRFGHEDLPDRQPLDVHAQDPARDFEGFIGRRGQLDATRLASSAHVYLGLDHHPRAQFLRDTPGVFGRPGHLLPRDRHPVPGEEALRLEFVYVQFLLLCFSTMPPRASKLGFRVGYIDLKIP